MSAVVSVLMMYVEVLCAQLIFSPFFKRREKFWLRFVGGVVISAEIIFLIWLLYGWLSDNVFVYEGSGVSLGGVDGLFKFGYYLIVFAMSVWTVFFCFEGLPWKALFYCAGGYALQHLAVNLSAVLKYLLSISGTSALSYVIDAAFCAAAYTAVYFMFIRGKEAYDNVRSIKMKTLVAVAVIFICIGLSRVTTDDPSRGSIAFLAESLYAIVSCFLVLCLLFNISRSDRISNEVDVMDELLRREREQYRLSKESIEIINIKCHDLKHQIKALRKDASEEYIKKLEDAIMIYDSAVKTGNDILDVILSEKCLLCENNSITLTCVMNGKALGFMENMDVYSLFGNALSNAMESVGKVAEKDRRCISVTSKEIGDIFSVHIENFFDGEIVFEDGLPQTAGDKNNHGFGMKSMKYIAEKYGGYMNVSAQDNKFCLDFIFPLPKK